MGRPIAPAAACSAVAERGVLRRHRGAVEAVYAHPPGHRSGTRDTRRRGRPRCRATPMAPKPGTFVAAPRSRDGRAAKRPLATANAGALGFPLTAVALVAVVVYLAAV